MADEKDTAEKTTITASELDSKISKAVADGMEPVIDKLAEKLETSLKGLGSESKPPEGEEVEREKVHAEPKVEDKTFGYKNMGDFLRDVQTCSPGSGVSMTSRLASMHEKAAIGMGENVGSDGGFLVPTDFVMNVWQRSIEAPENLLNRADVYPISGNRMVLNADAETSRKDGSRHGGVEGKWLDEGTEKTATHPEICRLELNLHKLAILVYATDELLEDSAVALDTYVNKKASDEITFKVSDSLIRGTGAGMPLGVLNAPCLISVAAQPGQAAATIVAENVSDMWSRMWGPSRRNAVWLINQDIEPELDNMTINVGTGGVPVYLPAGGYSASPYSTLKGRPVIPVEWCSTLGTVGDIILCDWSQYVAATKTSGIQAAVSMHVRFIYDESTFRFVMRIDGQPWWQLPLTPYQGTTTLSPFVALATRP